MSYSEFIIINHCLHSHSLLISSPHLTIIIHHDSVPPSRAAINRKPYPIFRDNITVVKVCWFLLAKSGCTPLQDWQNLGAPSEDWQSKGPPSAYILSCNVHALTTPYTFASPWRRTTWLYCDQLSYNCLCFSHFSLSIYYVKLKKT